MKTFYKIIVLLAVVGVAGFYFGWQNRETITIFTGNNSPIPSALPDSGIFLVDDKGEVISLEVENRSSSLFSSVPWYVSRASAITAYFLMFFVIVWGFGMTAGFTYKLTNPIKAWTIHKYMSVGLGFTILVHAFSLLFDEFISFEIVDVLIPFYSDYKPVYLGLGIIGFYILLAIILSSLLLRIRTPKFWRGLHYFVYPLFAVSLVHGLFLGTDSQTPAMQIAYWLTGIIFAGLVFYRFALFGRRAKS